MFGLVFLVFSGHGKVQMVSVCRDDDSGPIVKEASGKFQC